MKKRFTKTRLLSALLLFTVINVGLDIYFFLKKSLIGANVKQINKSDCKQPIKNRAIIISEGPSACNNNHSVKNEKDDEYLFTGCNNYF